MLHLRKEAVVAKVTLFTPRQKRALALFIPLAEAFPVLVSDGFVRVLARVTAVAARLGQVVEGTGDFRDRLRHRISCLERFLVLQAVKRQSQGMSVWIHQHHH